MSQSTALAAKSGQEYGGSDFATINTCQLREAVRLHYPIHDSRGVLLLAAGAVVTAAIIERLIRRGVTSIRVHRGDLSRICKAEGAGGGGGGGGSSSRSSPTISVSKVAGARSSARAGSSKIAVPKPVVPKAVQPREGDLLAKLATALNSEDAALPESNNVDLETPAEDPVLAEKPAAQGSPRGEVAYDAQLRKEVALRQQQSLDHMERMFQTMHEVRRGDVESLEGVSCDALVNMVQDMDLFVSLGITPGADKYPARHSTQSAMLAMALGTNLGLEKRNVVELGVGCLTHDVGMLQMRVPVFQTEGALDPISFLEITKHPSHTFDLMRGVDQLAGCSRLVAYQMHERCDGSGYPRRRRDNQIHPLAKIAAVADVFVALISPRSYRPPILPYFAMEHMLRSVRQGKFDAQAVRALLHTLSLFPLGSCVELTDGRAARVLRSNGENFMRPVIEAWHPSNLDATPEIIDLSQRPEINVSRPLIDLADASGEPLAQCACSPNAPNG